MNIFYKVLCNRRSSGDICSKTVRFFKINLMFKAVDPLILDICIAIPTRKNKPPCTDGTTK